MKKFFKLMFCIASVISISSCQSVDFEKLGTENEKEEKNYSNQEKEFSANYREVGPLKAWKQFLEDNVFHQWSHC